MPISEARRKANEKYNAKTYDEIKVRVPKGHKAELQAHATQRGESLNGFIGRAIDEQINRDREKSGGKTMKYVGTPARVLKIEIEDNNHNIMHSYQQSDAERSLNAQKQWAGQIMGDISHVLGIEEIPQLIERIIRNKNERKKYDTIEIQYEITEDHKDQVIRVIYSFQRKSDGSAFDKYTVVGDGNVILSCNDPDCPV